MASVETASAPRDGHRVASAVESGQRGGDIVCSGLYKWFGDSPVIASLDLYVARNQFVCVVGPSGCGKTTLLRMMAGLASIDSGTIAISGQRVTEPLASVAVVFQHYGLFPWKTVFHNVALPLRAAGVTKGEAARRANDALKLVGLNDIGNQYPAQLSGGMKQRVGLARALAIQPEVVLLDEPFAAVDAQTREILQEELLALWSRYQQTAVFVTHSIDEAITLADRVIVMGAKPGRILDDIEVPIGRPRSVASVRRHESYAPLREQIWEQLRGSSTAGGERG